MPTMSPEELSQWLQGHRERRGWSRREMAKQLIEAGRQRKEKHIPDTDTLKQYVYRWEGGKGISHLYVLLYCDVLGIEYVDFPRQLRAGAGRGKAAVPAGPSVPGGAHVASKPTRATSRDTQWNAIEEYGEEEMERRRLLQSLAALGVEISPLGEALETVRTVLGDTVGYDERHQLDQWEELIADYACSYLAASPADLIPDLATDILAVRSVIHGISDKNAAEYRSWCRVGGILSALMAKSLSNLGQYRNSREWWSMAQHLSDASGDLELGLWVRGDRIIHGFYENRPVPVLLRQVDSAAEFSRDHPCAGLAKLSVGRAQALTLAGDYHSAERELHRLEGILDGLPSAVTSDNSSAMGWAEDRFRYTQAWVYSHMGDSDKTDHAAGLALALYPDSDSRTPAQVKLIQAFARVRRGDVLEGIRHAQAVYEPLSSGQSTAMVNSLAQRILNSVPAEARQYPDIAEYRALVTPPTLAEDG